MNIIDVGLQFAGPMSKRSKTTMKIVHHLEAEGATWTVQEINHMHITEKQFKFSGIGYNFYIRLDGTIYRGRPIDVIGAHCKGNNATSIGIAFEGDYDKRTTMPTAQYNAWCWLSKQIDSIYGTLPTFGHREKGQSECPGKYFPLDKVKNATKEDYTVGWHPANGTWWYCTNSSGWYYRDTWKEIDNDWYCFNHDGYVKVNDWQKYKDKWYYLGSNGKMQKSKWIHWKNKDYYVGSDGAMLVNTTTPDGYKVDENGAWIK